MPLLQPLAKVWDKVTLLFVVIRTPKCSASFIRRKDGKNDFLGDFFYPSGSGLKDFVSVISINGFAFAFRFQLSYKPNTNCYHFYKSGNRQVIAVTNTELYLFYNRPS